MFSCLFTITPSKGGCAKSRNYGKLSEVTYSFGLRKVDKQHWIIWSLDLGRLLDMYLEES